MAYEEYIDENGDMVIKYDEDEGSGVDSGVYFPEPASPVVAQGSPTFGILCAYIGSNPNARMTLEQAKENAVIWDCLVSANMSPSLAIRQYQSISGKELSKQLMSKKRAILERILG